jgi:hypothetical protein
MWWWWVVNDRSRTECEGRTSGRGGFQVPGLIIYCTGIKGFDSLLASDVGGDLAIESERVDMEGSCIRLVLPSCCLAGQPEFEF